MAISLQVFIMDMLLKVHESEATLCDAREPGDVPPREEEVV